ncbi:MAG: phenylalanine--tRNA ligase subunit beta, partial [Oscillospiraceae bacterium]
VQVPSWRATKDVTIKADIIEEITRIYGYDNFKISTSKSALFPVLRSAGNFCDNSAKDILVRSYALHEVHSYLWCDGKKQKEIGIEAPNNVRLLNAINPDFLVLRDSMIPTLLTFVNENKSYGQSFGIFEIGRVVCGLKENGECNERKKLGIVLYSRTENEKELYLKLRDIVAAIGEELKHTKLRFTNTQALRPWQHPVNTANIELDGHLIGSMNTLYPTVKNKIDKKASIVSAELDMDSFAAIEAEAIHYSEPSRYPSIDIDLSLVVVGDTVYGDLENAWKNVTPLLKAVNLIDIYDGEQKSLTLRFGFSSGEKTLSKAEVQVFVDKILANLAKTGVHIKA